MKCPILMYNYLPDENPTEGKRTDCIKEDCAWWDKDFTRCSVLTIAVKVGVLQSIVKDVRDKMPSPEFFKK